MYVDPRAEACIRANLRAHGVQELDDDVRQLVASHLWSKGLQSTLDRVNEPEDVYKLLFATARNVCRTLKKGWLSDMRRNVELQPEPLDADEWSVHPAAEDSTLSAVVGRVDRANAERELNRRLAVFQPESEGKKAGRKQVKGASGKPSPEELETAAFLKRVRLRTGASNARLALGLGVSEGTLAAYLSGRVRSLPAAVRARAVRLESECAAEASALGAKPEQLTVADQIERWKELLAITHLASAETDRRIAATIGVDRATVWRWRTARVRPPSTEDLRAYDRVVRRTRGAT
jgi:transcriptional regulator with XRE-family HTH domain